MSRSTSLTLVISPNRTRLLTLVAAPLTWAVLCPAAVSAETYGKLVARHSSAPSTMLETRFGPVRPARSFLLVVTEPTKDQLNFSWAVHCYDSAHRESGGASGQVTVGTGHWVKRVRANWIKSPVSCSGSVSGSAATSPVLVRVFAR